MRLSGLFLTVLLPLSPPWDAHDAPPRRITIGSLTLNDLSNQPVSPELPARMQLLRSALRERMRTACGYEVVALEARREALAGSGPGYLYAHPDLAVELVGGKADWVIIPRLNRASPWVTDCKLMSFTRATRRWSATASWK